MARSRRCCTWIVRDARTEFFRLAGLPIAPVRTWRAFQRGRSSGNSYDIPWDGKWLDASLGSLRTRLVLDADSRPSNGGDVPLFLVYALPGLFGVAALIIGVVMM